MSFKFLLLLFQKIHQELEQKKRKRKEEELQRGGTRERRPERNGVRDRGRHRGSTKQKTEEEYELGRGLPTRQCTPESREVVQWIGIRQPVQETQAPLLV